MANGIIYDTAETEATREYKRGYREGFQDGYAASKKPQIVTDQNGVILYWPKGACICGNTGECNCKSQPQLLNEVN